MGAWGHGILQNDTTEDIWTQFKEHYNKGLSPKEIRLLIEKEYNPEEDDEAYADVWTGIAYGQWMCGGLEPSTIKKLRPIITKKKGLLPWSDDEKLLAKRIKAVQGFIEKIQVARPKPMARKKTLERGLYFSEGDVITIELDNGCKTAAIVETGQKGNINDNNILVFVDLMQKEISIADVLQADIMYLDRPGEDKYYRGYFHAMFVASNMSKQIKRANKIGEIKLNKKMMLGAGTPMGAWQKISGLYQQQAEFLQRSKSERPFKVTVQDYLKRDKSLEMQLIDWDKKIFMEKMK